MLELFAEELDRCDRRLAADPAGSLPEILAAVPLEVFAELLLGVPERWPALAARLPTMAPDEVQRNWTGNCGAPLMQTSLAFVRQLLALRGRQGCRPAAEARVLDFGCGWGRLLRLLLKEVPADRLHGVDPMPESIALCREHGLPCQLALSDYLPRELPFAGPFDLIYAFSVFTHLSERTARLALATLRTVIAADGLLCLTIRPVEYWAATGSAAAADHAARHRATGFAFLPHTLAPIDGEITYGDTSLTLAALAGLAPGWRVAAVEWSAVDALQVLVALRPA